MTESRTQDPIETCNVPGCPNLAHWTATVLVWPRGLPRNSIRPLDFEYDTPFCNTHRLDFKESDFLSEEIWSFIVDWCLKHGHGEPSRDTAEVRFKRLPEIPTSQPSAVH